MTDGVVDGEGGAAEILGVPPSTLRSRMKKLGRNLRKYKTTSTDAKNILVNGCQNRS
jgi:hypothetical protein